MNMKGIQSNGFLPIIAQAIAEMEETHGESETFQILYTEQ